MCAISSPFYAQIDVHLLLNALNAACRKLSVGILENCRITDLLIDNDEAIGVKTKNGELLSEGVVVASGYSSFRFTKVYPGKSC